MYYTENAPQVKDSNREEKLDQVAALLVKAFSGPKEIATWISLVANALVGRDMKAETRKAFWGIGDITFFLTKLIEIRRMEDKIDAAREFIEQVIEWYSDTAIFAKKLNVIEKVVIDTVVNYDISAMRIVIYQFDALKEIGQLIE